MLSTYCSHPLTATLASVFRPTWVSYLVNDKTLILIANSLFIVGDVFSASIMAFHLNKSRENILGYVHFQFSQLV